jgi:P-type E1-E2 ATPase
MLDRLRHAGIKHTLMVTGDNPATAAAISKGLGITDIKSDCLPSDKMLAIENVEHPPVAFVGDGVNDAPVLTAADVGIALGAKGSTAASQSADVVIMLDDVSKVASSIEIAQRTFSIARQSILMGIVISIGLMGIFSTGRFRAVHGAAIQELVDITVIVNALRAHGSGRKARSK